MSSFNINFPGTPSDFVVSASKKLQDNGGALNGDDSQGTFSVHTLLGRVEGTYQIQAAGADKTPIAVTITHKPFLVSTSQIQEAIGEYF